MYFHPGRKTPWFLVCLHIFIFQTYVENILKRCTVWFMGFSSLTAKRLKEEQKHVPVAHVRIYSAWFWLIVFFFCFLFPPVARRRRGAALYSFQKRYCIRNYPTAALLATVSQLGLCVLVFVCQEAWNVASRQTPETIWNANLFTRLSAYSVKWTDGAFGRWRRSVTPSSEPDYRSAHALQVKAPHVISRLRCALTSSGAALHLFLSSPTPSTHLLSHAWLRTAAH